MDVVSNLSPLFSLNESLERYSGAGKGDIKALCVKIKIRGVSLNEIVFFLERSFESTPARFPKVTEPRAAGLYGTVPQSGKIKTSASSKTEEKSSAISRASASVGTTIIKSDEKTLYLGAFLLELEY